MSEIIIEAFGYGPRESRVEVSILYPIPENMRGNSNLIKSWCMDLVLFTLQPDLKHNGSWGCEICSKPARETNFTTATWTHLPQPRAVVYIHHLCEAGENPCNQAIIAQNQMMAAMTPGIGPQAPAKIREKPEGVEFPLSASCCNCKKDSTGTPDARLRRCARCKLVRYCSTECQVTDWPRHKQNCKHIKSVKWVN
ncbi:hypothetical protein D9613_001508 [Agrocybe pediades]|uniref:MYND-type domain-containing protein n=1 Tax=Agrocybe pediades TaxID=84607 RepID=A0A8H4R5Z9_9AGAR|nr:hypothetical protein D9613_001508 [Agrocybe pediades]